MLARQSRILGLAVAAGSFLLAGCVDRRFVVESNPPGAQVDVDGVPLGVSPVDSQFIYAGERVVTVSAPGRETVKQRVRLKAKWHQYPPLDFIAEILYPGRIEDVRRVRIDLPVAKPVSDQQLLGQGENLRARGMSLPPPSVPNDTNPPKGTTPVASTTGPFFPLPPGASPNAPVDPRVPATTLAPLASPRDGDVQGGIIRP